MVTSNKQKGFSLIELVVVLAIFSLILGVTADIFLSVVKNQKKILEEQELLNQTSYAIEYISTGLKMAKSDPDGDCLGAEGNMYVLTHCTGALSQPCSGIKFINQLDNDACTEFFLDSSINPVNPPLRELRNGITQNLLSNKFTVKYARFILNGDKTVYSSYAMDSIQPRVTILLDVKTQSVGTLQEKIVQTTVSQRNLNEGGFVATTCNLMNQCVEGGGGTACMSDAQCGGGGGGPSMTCNPSHQCVVGGGGSPCTADINCFVATTCNPSHQCVVNGGGTACMSDANCITPSLTCNVLYQCIEGGGGAPCTSPLDCSFGPPGP